MAEEPWNKINIPLPSAISSSRIEFTKSTDMLIEHLLADCEKVLSLLCSEVLQTEIRVMYELLYVLNKRFRQHKPFQALKQVEQCINRLKEMKLQSTVQDMKELCPNKFQRDAGAEVGECDVPSQPMLEWQCLKQLGASSLLARLLERCTQAFIWTRRHLRLGEFIVTNVVITSMLSRLWVFFRGILRALIPMYKRTFALLRVVSQSQPMAYLSNFSLPGDLKDFLCLPPGLLMEETTKHSSRVARRTRKTKFSLLNRLFGDSGKVEDNGEEKGAIMQILGEGASLDLGATVLERQRDISPCGLNMKVMLQESCKNTKRPQSQLDVSNRSADHQRRRFVKWLKKVSSFSQMSDRVKEVMQWCWRCRFHQERKRLAFLHLKCLRMECLEAEGVRVEKRFKKFKIKVRKALMIQSTFQPKRFSSLAAVRRARWRNRPFIARNRTALRICSKNMFVSVKHRRNHNSQRHVTQAASRNMARSVKEENGMESELILKKSNVSKDDIDDIFACFGL